MILYFSICICIYLFAKLFIDAFGPEKSIPNTLWKISLCNNIGTSAFSDGTWQTITHHRARTNLCLNYGPIFFTQKTIPTFISTQMLTTTNDNYRMGWVSIGWTLKDEGNKYEFRSPIS